MLGSSSIASTQHKHIETGDIYYRPGAIFVQLFHKIFLVKVMFITFLFPPKSLDSAHPGERRNSGRNGIFVYREVHFSHVF